MEDGRLTDRQAIRHIVLRQNEILAEAARRGDNVNQLALDLGDEFDRRLSGLTEQEQSVLREVYRQEIIAANAHAELVHKRKLAQLELEDAERELAEAEKELTLVRLQAEAQESVQDSQLIGGIVAFFANRIYDSSVLPIT